jgi:hypothetical protein
VIVEGSGEDGVEVVVGPFALANPGLCRTEQEAAPVAGVGVSREKARVDQAVGDAGNRAGCDAESGRELLGSELAGLDQMAQRGELSDPHVQSRGQHAAEPVGGQDHVSKLRPEKPYRLVSLHIPHSPVGPQIPAT